MSDRTRNWQRFQTLLAEIAERRKHLAFAADRLTLANSAVAKLKADFLAIQCIGHPETSAGVIELIRETVLCRELGALLLVWIKTESAAIENLEAEAVTLETKYE